MTPIATSTATLPTGLWFLDSDEDEPLMYSSSTVASLGTSLTTFASVARPESCGVGAHVGDTFYLPCGTNGLRIVRP